MTVRSALQLLLDTHALSWWASGDMKLTRRVRTAIKTLDTR